MVLMELLQSLYCPLQSFYRVLMRNRRAQHGLGGQVMELTRPQNAGVLMELLQSLCRALTMCLQVQREVGGQVVELTRPQNDGVPMESANAEVSMAPL